MKTRKQKKKWLIAGIALLFVIIVIFLNMLWKKNNTFQESIQNFSYQKVQRFLKHGELLQPVLDTTEQLFFVLSYDKDEDFDVEKDAILAWLFENYQDFYIYGSRGDQKEFYENRYTGIINWMDEDGNLLEVKLYREEKKPYIEFRRQQQQKITAVVTDIQVDEKYELQKMFVSVEEMTEKKVECQLAWYDQERQEKFPYEVGDKLLLYYSSQNDYAKSGKIYVKHIRLQP